MDLRQALAAASTQIEERLTTNAVLQLQEKSKRVALALQAMYEVFFSKLESLIDSGEIGSRDAIPALISPYTQPWEGLSWPWFKSKSRSRNRSALNFYIGLSDQVGARLIGRGLLTATYKQTHKRGRFRSMSRTKPLYKFMEALANDSQSTGRYFGNGSIAYELRRTNGKVIKLAPGSPPGSIGGLAEKPGKRFLEGLDGTKLTAVVYVFPKLNQFVKDLDQPSVRGEQRVVGFMAREDSVNKSQWVKIMGTGKGGFKPIRPVVTPLLKWYLDVGMKRVLRNLV